MSDLLRKAIKLGMDLNLWPPEFVKGCYAVAVKNRLNVVSVMLAFVTGTSVFVGKSEIKIDKTDRTECGSLWVLNVQVCFLNRIFVLHRNNFLFFKKKPIWFYFSGLRFKQDSVAQVADWFGRQRHDRSRIPNRRYSCRWGNPGRTSRLHGSSKG